MSGFNRAFAVFGRRMAILTGLLVLIISLLSTFEVVMRYFLNAPTSWSFELSRYLFLLLIWCGAIGTLQNDSHISVDFVVERIPKPVRRIVSALGYAVALAFSVVLAWQTWIFYLKAVENGWETLGNFPIPASWLYLVILLGNVFLCVAFLQKIWEIVISQESRKMKIEV